MARGSCGYPIVGFSRIVKGLTCQAGFRGLVAGFGVTLLKWSSSVIGGNPLDSKTLNHPLVKNLGNAYRV